MSRKVVIIGGGASGLMAAYSSALCGDEVAVIEKNNILGRKLRITGKGRCNVTNNCDLNELMKNIPRNGRFLYSAFSKLSTADVIRFFEEQGVPLKTERGNRVFPKSDSAADVANALADACKKLGVTFKTADVSKLLIENGVVHGVECKNGGIIKAEKVIVATGGRSYPLTGSDGSGYELARQAGHTITDIIPSLVPLVSKDEACGDMQGLSLKNVTLSLFEVGKPKPIYKELGEMLFTHFGMSGPLILSASAHINGFSNAKFYVKIDLKPGLTSEQLDARLLRDFEKNINRDFANSLDELLPRKMIPIIVMRSKIPPLIKVNSITKEQRRQLIDVLKSLEISVDGFRPIDEAIITSGGVNVKEINPKNMESKLVSGIHFVGEMLDVDGYTGGFNLQIAFATGYVAGNSEE